MQNDNGGSASPEGKTPPVFQPGSTIGILGGGQLGRMSAMAAKSLGYRVVVFDDTRGAPAFSCADIAVEASFDDLEALDRFSKEVDVVTVEFENIPIAALEFLEKEVCVRPSSSVVRICQDRILEKEFLQGKGFPVAPFRVIKSAEELAEGLSDLNTASILKTAALGYDGKGQINLSPGDDTKAAWDLLGTPQAVLEKRIKFVSEASVICARSPGGEMCCFPVQSNVHRHGILDVTVSPACIDEPTSARALEIAAAITEKLGVVGLLTVEFFLLSDGGLMVNELAPRPHNSGHHTIETAFTSQFAQHVRAVCGLPLGSVELRSPGVMINLMGDLWEEGEPHWGILLSQKRGYLHLYGKKDSKPGRKMGHFTLLGEGEGIVKVAVSLRDQLAQHSRSGKI